VPPERKEILSREGREIEEVGFIVDAFVGARLRIKITMLGCRGWQQTPIACEPSVSQPQCAW
jgi:hypothetical protein